MSINVTKRDGRVEPLDLDKIHKVLNWACEGLTGVSVSEIALKARLSFFQGITTKEIHTALIKSAADLISDQGINYQYVAGNLLNYDLRKTAWGGNGITPPRLYDHVVKMVHDGYYTSELLDFYSEDQWDKMDNFIDHERDFNMTYIGLNEYVTKYTIRNRSLAELTPLETPQLTYMLIAALSCLDTKEVKHVKSMYNDFSQWNISLPTPIMAGLRGPEKQFSSCTLISSGDNISSITATSEAIVKYAANKAGIGVDASRIRAEGDVVKKSKSTKHTGVIPFLRAFEGALKSSAQGSIRGASGTCYLALWHLEAMDLLVLKNNKGTQDNRVRKLDYGFQINNYLYNRLIDGQDITLFSPSYRETPGLYDAFFNDSDEFIRLYEKYEADPNIRKKTIPASELFSSFITERKETGRIYVFNVDNVNNNSCFKKAITTSNLCLTGDTEVWINGDGRNPGIPYSIKTVVDWFNRDNSNIRTIKSYNVRNGVLAFNKVLNAGLTVRDAEVFELKTQSGKTIKCTADHKIFNASINDYQELKNFKTTDSVLIYPYLAPDKVVSIIKLELPEDVYDLTIETDNNFFANDILVHNCAEITLPTTPLATYEEEIIEIDESQLLDTITQLQDSDIFLHKIEII